MTPEGEAPALLSPVLTMQQVAKRAGWTLSRMRRFLVAKNQELGGGLLVNAGRGKMRHRWTISVAALHALAPQWFNDPESLQRQLDELREENESLKWRVARLERVVEMQTNRLVEAIALVNAITVVPRKRAR